MTPAHANAGRVATKPVCGGARAASNDSVRRQPTGRWRKTKCVYTRGPAVRAASAGRVSLAKTKCVYTRGPAASADGSRWRKTKRVYTRDECLRGVWHQSTGLVGANKHTSACGAAERRSGGAAGVTKCVYVYTLCFLWRCHEPRILVSAVTGTRFTSVGACRALLGIKVSDLHRLDMHLDG